MNMRRSNREAGSAARRVMLIVWLRRKFKIEQYGLRRQASVSCRAESRHLLLFPIERNVTGIVRDFSTSVEMTAARKGLKWSVAICARHFPWQIAGELNNKLLDRA